MGRLIAVAFAGLLLAGAIAKYRQSQTQNCTTGQCTPPAASSLTAMPPKTTVSPSAQPPAIPSGNAQQAIPLQPATRPSSPLLSPLDKAREEAFQAGKVEGELEALREIERREDKARQEGKESGLIEGEAKGHEEGMKLGETVGYAKAAAEEFRKGQKQGAKFGRLEGTAEAQKEMMQLIDEAEREAEARGEKQGYVTGFTTGLETQRRESFYRVAGVATSVSALFAAMLFFVCTKREPGSVAEYRKLEKERRKLREETLAVDAMIRDWVLAQYGEYQKMLSIHNGDTQESHPEPPFPYTSRGATNGKH